MTPTVLALDTEDDSAGAVGIVNFFDGREHVTFTREEYGSDLRPAAWAWLEGRAPAVVWACNQEYDLVNLCGDWLDDLVTLQYVGAGLMRATWSRARLTFYDTLRHWPMGVEGMGEQLGLPKLEFVPGAGADAVAYCRRDTEIVWMFQHEMVGRYEALGLRLRPTLPSMAFQLFTKRFWRQPWPHLPEGIRDFFRQGYYGGRVEVYRLGRVPGPVRHYDVNSLFPSVMAAFPYPDLREWEETGSPDLGREGMARATVQVPETEYPPVPARLHDEIVYPWGRMTGTWTYPELRRIEADGGRILHVDRAVECRRVCWPFRAFVRFCYARRRIATTVLDRTHWKFVMNSLYGKFGQSNEGAVTIYRGREILSRRRPGAHANVIWSAYITAYARLALLDRLRQTSATWYTDTDSLFTPDVLPVGTGLGELKQEGEYDWAEFAGNKLYVLAKGTPGRGRCPEHKVPHDDCVGRPHAKAKGVRPESALEYIRTGRAVFRKPARYRESRRNFLAANVWYPVEKVRRETYTKRRVLAGGRTEPWEWKAYVRSKR